MPLRHGWQVARAPFTLTERFMRKARDMSEAVTIELGDTRLCGRLYRPGGAVRAAAVLNGATGVPARFYAAFAEWLARERGIACLIWDYRDFGWSGDARDSPATMNDWGIADSQAARDWLTRACPDVPLWVIGHSLGGMMLPFQRDLGGIARVICVAAGAVHVGDHPWPYQAVARAFWSPVLPWLARRAGYVPLHRLRLGHDLPRGVYLQWRRWCTTHGFHAADPDLPDPDATALNCPMRIVAVADDALCPPVSVWRLGASYPAARQTRVLLRPEAFGLARLGHLHVLGARGHAAWAEVVGDGLDG
ncbi:alpha/beta hydrolase [Jannaschia sp. S6380]|uniref:alpha/beta hydrolase family protein n=1 Tax=Jannaschia sp. S6380 TaxID=2926408 RepID=UPI001FF338FB|nr:alpha/beta fold hydrolase [Jannaschia sp. S6380]MCK0169157.1 alpha/beta hydrolase [Jannaschia sp. S6380]